MAGMAFFLLKSRRNYTRLPELPVAETNAAPDVTVIIPARNEEAVIRRVVASFPGLRVIVVDDASEDGTVKAAMEAGAEVYRAPPLDPCVLGKPNACRAGAAVAESEWLLFVDADTWYAPTFAASMVAYADSESVDMVSAFLRQQMWTPPEKMLLPYAFALYFCGVSAVRVNSSGSSESLANGQCLLIRRGAYQAIGGHGAVARSVIEDVALASLAKSRGVRLRVARAEHIGAVRMYESWAAIRRGFEKNSFRFLGANPWTGAQVILASIFLTSYLPVLALLLLDAYYLAAGLFAIVPVVLLIPWYSSARFAFSAPLAIYAFQSIVLSAMFHTITGVKTKWKGRDV